MHYWIPYWIPRGEFFFLISNINLWPHRSSGFLPKSGGDFFVLNTSSSPWIWYVPAQKCSPAFELCEYLFWGNLQVANIFICFSSYVCQGVDWYSPNVRFRPLAKWLKCLGFTVAYSEHFTYKPNPVSDIGIYARNFDLILVILFWYKMLSTRDSTSYVIVALYWKWFVILKASFPVHKFCNFRCVSYKLMWWKKVKCYPYLVAYTQWHRHGSVEYNHLSSSNNACTWTLDLFNC